MFAKFVNSGCVCFVYKHLCLAMPNTQAILHELPEHPVLGHFG